MTTKLAKAHSGLAKERGAERFEFSIVIPTLGRREEVLRLLQSLEDQSLRGFEVIVVDQNDDDRLAKILAHRSWRFSLAHVRTPGQRGASRARNAGLRQSRGSKILFADDDCWYAPWILAKSSALFTTTGAHIVSGRAANTAGKNINGRFEESSQWVNRRNIWTTSIEWMIFFQREALEAVNGFDETVGIGADTPWQAAEGQDVVLRALAAGYTCYFDPSLYGFHPEQQTAMASPELRGKARAYGRGMGYVLRRHNYGWVEAFYWIIRPLASVLIQMASGTMSCALYHLNASRGRWEGWHWTARRDLA
jgi:glycosyltransferase involved in cell wall biosynthesis